MADFDPIARARTRAKRLPGGESTIDRCINNARLGTALAIFLSFAIERVATIIRRARNSAGAPLVAFPTRCCAGRPLIPRPKLSIHASHGALVGVAGGDFRFDFGLAQFSPKSRGNLNVAIPSFLPSSARKRASPPGRPLSPPAIHILGTRPLTTRPHLDHLPIKRLAAIRRLHRKVPPPGLLSRSTGYRTGVPLRPLADLGVDFGMTQLRVARTILFRRPLAGEAAMGR